MNIFVLDNDPIIAAQLQCDKHVIKMILESAQLLSTAHRILDGRCIKNPKECFILDDSNMNNNLYKATHKNHPCSIWTRESNENYIWLFNHFCALCDEYTFRYNKKHKCYNLIKYLKIIPTNIPHIPLTQFKLAMKEHPECMVNDPIQSYRNYYKTKKDKFKMIWTNRQVPEWFT